MHFQRLTAAVVRFNASPAAFALALGFILVWLFTGPLFQYSDTWQLVVNTSTTIATFLMGFLIMNYQAKMERQADRYGQALQIKLDELIHAIDTAHNALLDVESLSDSEITALRAHYHRLAQQARADLRAGKTDFHTHLEDGQS